MISKSEEAKIRQKIRYHYRKAVENIFKQGKRAEKEFFFHQACFHGFRKQLHPEEYEGSEW